MHEGCFTSRTYKDPRRKESDKVRISAVEQEIFKCEGMVERGFSTNHSIITDFIPKNKKDSDEIVEMIFKLHDRLQDLQAQFYDLENQNSEYESHFKRMSIAANFSIPHTSSSFFNG
ncbi:hypothetical protein D1007_38786 [Hordeum vulgare]|nr:hypothetical protein D1007_38786 [Hordeum vulgare]